MTELPILYKLTSKGQIQQWQIIVDGNKFFTIEGIKGGKLTQSLPTECFPKNIGRANATTAESQAYNEALAKHTKKINSGYDEVLRNEDKFFKPMLAHKLELDKLDFNVGVYIQPKLDGIRAINANNKLMSRNGKEFVSCPHLYQDKVILDGELYSHQYNDNFNKIVSLVKRYKLTQEDLESTRNIIKHYVYDFPSHQGIFSERYLKLKEWLEFFDKKHYFELVPTYRIENNKQLDEYHSLFLEQGYEGSIIRLDIGPYENKHSKQLLKNKEWQDSEYTILDIIEGIGNRTGTVGKFVLKLDENNTFESNIKGEFPYLRELWDTRNELIGKTATVKFFNFTPAGVPRFPYVIKIFRESYE